jgi:hypothetical protein
MPKSKHRKDHKSKVMSYIKEKEESIKKQKREIMNKINELNLNQSN